MLKTQSGQTVDTLKQIGEGGQGRVFSIRETDKMVFKQYSAESLREDTSLVRRITLMVAKRPARWQDPHSHHVVLTWPSNVVLDDGVFVGFLMPTINQDRTLALHRISNPSDARTETQGPKSWAHAFTWRYLVSTAANLAAAVASLHETAVVIGDFNDANVLVWSDATVTLVDCDSMQITDPQTGEHYLCHVGRPGFTPPELLNADWATTVRAPSSDLFGLAVHIHQLLLEGEHPYRGVWHGPGEVPPSQELARRGLWAYAGDHDLSPRPTAIGIDLLPADLTQLFHRAFVDGATNPRHRPSATEWHDALTTLSLRLKTCAKTPSHCYSMALLACPWCAHQAERAKARAAARRTPPPPPAVHATRPTAVPVNQPTRPRMTARPVPPPIPKPPPPPPPPPPPARTPVRSTIVRRHPFRSFLVVAAVVGVLFFVFHHHSNPQPAASPETSVAAPPPFDTSAVALTPSAGGDGYWVVSADGQVDAYGNARDYGSSSASRGDPSIVALVSTPDGGGYWILNTRGQAFAYGDASLYGSLGSIGITDRAVGLAPTSDGRGYWIAAADGGVFAFGDAQFYGSAASSHSTPIVGIASDDVTGGYWLAGADGGVFAFNAPYLGSAEPFHDLNPVVGIESDRSGMGYRLATSNGGVFAFGLPYQGSMSTTQINEPAVGISARPSGTGYWIVAQDGGIFCFGGAPYLGNPSVQ